MIFNFLSFHAMFFSDFLNLLFPEACAACDNALYKGEQILCSRCLLMLPKTGFHEEAGNPVEKAFWGKVPLHSATALYHFNKGERVQHLIHRLKYHGEREAGQFAGRILGEELCRSPRFASVEMIVPVPLHRGKLKTRGFNQSEAIAHGIGEAYGVPVCGNLIERTVFTSTQTRKSRYERFENVNRAFRLNSSYPEQARHYLLVDDVITTGSTLTACAEVLCAIPGARVSVVALAYARY